jgi:hypothetical protein
VGRRTHARAGGLAGIVPASRPKARNARNRGKALAEKPADAGHCLKYSALFLLKLGAYNPLLRVGPAPFALP